MCEEFFSAAMELSDTQVDVERGRKIYRQRMKKIELLFEHYDVPRTGEDAIDFRHLALVLALDIGIPGFQVRPQKKQKRKRVASE